jgi:hypothetical protein
MNNTITMNNTRMKRKKKRKKKKYESIIIHITLYFGEFLCIKIYLPN